MFCYRKGKLKTKTMPQWQCDSVQRDMMYLLCSNTRFNSKQNSFFRDVFFTISVAYKAESKYNNVGRV